MTHIVVRINVARAERPALVSSIDSRRRLNNLSISTRHFVALLQERQCTANLCSRLKMVWDDAIIGVAQLPGLRL
jgi:hypothetical protein